MRSKHQIADLYSILPFIIMSCPRPALQNPVQVRTTCAKPWSGSSTPPSTQPPARNSQRKPPQPALLPLLLLVSALAAAPPLLLLLPRLQYSLPPVAPLQLRQSQLRHRYSHIVNI